MINRNTLKTGLCAAAISLGVLSSAAFSQAAVTAKKAATTTDKSSWGIFKDSKINLESTVVINDGSRNNKASYKIRPIFLTPMFKNAINLEFSVDITPEDEKGINQTSVNGGDLYLIKTLVSSEALLLEPYLAVSNIFDNTRGIRPSLRTIASAPIYQGDDGKITAFAYNETNAAFHTDEVLTAENKRGEPNALGAVPIKDLEVKQVKNVDRAKVNTWTRVGLALEPSSFNGLKLTAGAEFDYTVNDPATVVSGTDVSVVGYKETFSTTPILRVDYSVSDRLAIRNHSSIAMDGLFDRPSLGNNKSKTGFTNYTEVTYTIL